MKYHDVLAALGVGSAHPGGFRITQQWMQKVAINPGMHILEVGCGTGRTACELRARTGATVTGVDIHPQMIAKAERRAQERGLDVHFLLTKPESLDFVDGSFDAVIVESVTVFTKAQRQLQEYYRVLKRGGFVVDTEMAAAATLPNEVMDAFSTLYGAVSVPSQTQWKAWYRQAGFSSARILLSGPVAMTSISDDIPDPQSYVSPEGYGREVFEMVEANQQVMSQYGKWLQYAVVYAQK